MNVLGQANYIYSFASATSSIYMRAGGNTACDWNKSIELAFGFSKNWAKEIPDCTEQTVQGMGKAPSTTTLRQVRTIKTINKEPTNTDTSCFLATKLALEKIPRGRSRDEWSSSEIGLRRGISS